MFQQKADAAGTHVMPVIYSTCICLLADTYTMTFGEFLGEQQYKFLISEKEKIQFAGSEILTIRGLGMFKNLLQKNDF